MTRYYRDAVVGPGGLDHAENIVPLYPEGHTAHQRAKLAAHMSQLQRFRDQAENVITQEAALETARAEVHNAHIKLEAQRYRFMTVAKLLAAMFDVYVDAGRDDLSEGARHARDFADRLATARMPATFDEVAREYLRSHPDSRYYTIAVDREAR